MEAEAKEYPFDNFVIEVNTAQVTNALQYYLDNILLTNYQGHVIQSIDYNPATKKFRLVIGSSK